MCPLYPLHLIFSWGIFLLLAWVCAGDTLAAHLTPNTSFSVTALLGSSPLKSIGVNEEEEKLVTFYIDDLPPDAAGEIQLKESSEDGLSHIELTPDRFPLQYSSSSEKFEANNVSVKGTFLGFSKIKLILSPDEGSQDLLQQEQEIRVEVHRETNTLDIIFIHVVVGLVLIAYVNMGCAINLEVIKDTMKRPVAPAIGLVSQYLCMPLVSYGIGYVLFPSSPELWLGLFLTGCAPGGGGSNMWTYLLGGSLDLSITMTFLSTVFAFATLPLWVLALGPSIFTDGYFGKLPYRNMATLVFGLVIPCCVGLGIRRTCPRAAEFLKQMLKPLSVGFIIFVMTFGVYTKLYLFSFFTWKVAFAGFCLPFFGFAFGGTAALLLKRNWEEVVAISIETGVQNTGLAIGVIKIALGHLSPLDDIAIVLPVAVATMTPLPLLLCLLAKCIKNRTSSKLTLEEDGIASPLSSPSGNGNSKACLK